ncbi:hypothetical protein ACFQ3N_14960 [Virgibacillus byunsanensis]|uniref:DUF4321 domain-containing protein n=1 Tax=Virgibacillus byunsanensis TaxID=570945 RepID=A0ABW3LQR1_9BACI
MKSENNILWGGFFGFVIGLVVSKVYQSWAILYRAEGMEFSGESAWKDGILSTPLWVRATKHSLGFTIVVVFIFIIIGIQFTKYLSSNIKEKSSEK